MTGAALPPLNATAGDLAQALDGEATALDQANTRTSDLIQIADACQKRQQAVLTALAPRPWYSGIQSAWKALRGSPGAAK